MGHSARKSFEASPGERPSAVNPENLSPIYITKELFRILDTKNQEPPRGGACVEEGGNLDQGALSYLPYYILKDKGAPRVIKVQELPSRPAGGRGSPRADHGLALPAGPHVPFSVVSGPCHGGGRDQSQHAGSRRWSFTSRGRASSPGESSRAGPPPARAWAVIPS